MDQHLAIYHILREKVAELQEFVHALLIADVFLDTVEES
jgi:hypothetical protein